MQGFTSSFLLISMRIVGFFLLSASALAGDPPSLIPAPDSIRSGKGVLLLRDGAAIGVPEGDKELLNAAEYLSDLIWRSYGVRLSARAGRDEDVRIELRRAARKDLPESYRLVVDQGQARLSASSYEGMLHATRTLWQLAAAIDNSGVISVPATRISDAPQFAWRGLMLDSARHYQSPEFIRNTIDWMALHKLNVLHWHLTDDQAWRLQIERYPKLTEVAAWRIPAGRAAAADIDAATGKPRRIGGFYTQQQVRDIVAHAASRGVRIVPEIEMPGHATAALIAYPQFAASRQLPADVPSDWGIYTHAYSVDEATFSFLEDVLDEVMELFPGEWIHVGGDEVSASEWRQSPSAQARMRELGISDPADLQHYFTQRIGRYLQERGRRLVGWDEILEPGLAKNAIVMSWRGSEGAVAATARGHASVLSPWPTLYFDNRQGIGGDEPPGRLRVISLEDVYHFDPLSGLTSTKQKKFLLGVQANLWTEHMRTESRVAWMTYPRAAALAEIGWSRPDRRDWKDFLRRLPALFARYDALGIPYADSAFAVHTKVDYLDAGHEARLTLSNQVDVGEIRYSLQAAEVGPDAPLYRNALKVKLPSQLSVASFSGKQRLSKTRQIRLAQVTAQRRTSAEMKLCSENIALALEDEAPLQGDRAVFHIDIQNPCWMIEQARLDGVDRIVAAVGDVPFNFQIGDAAKAIQFAKPETDEGELLVHLDSCSGELLARIPLAAAAGNPAVTELPAVSITPRQGRRDLCLRFAQTGIDPMRTLDWVHLLDASPSQELQQ